jgi:DNA repair protein RadC
MNYPHLTTSDYRLAATDLRLDFYDKKYDLKIRDLPPEKKPREKLAQHGPDALSVGELLAIVLGVGTRKEEVLAMSNRILKEYGGKAIVHEKNPEKLSRTLDIPLAKACQVVACFELGRRFFQYPGLGKPEYLRTAKQVFDYLHDMRALPKEHLRGLYLDNRFRLVHDEVISIGSLDANLVHPREVFRPALDHGAAAVILAHNHPSGSTEPSDADRIVTAQLVEAGKIMGVHVLDHIIIARHGFACVEADYS